MSNVYICMGGNAYEGASPLVVFDSLDVAIGWWRIDSKTKRQTYDHHYILITPMGSTEQTIHMIWESSYYKRVNEGKA